MNALDTLKQEWASRWEDALSLWSRYIKLKSPRWCVSFEEEISEKLSGSFAMIRLDDHAVVVSLRQVQAMKLEKFPLEIMGHEIGHHVYCPADLTDQGRLLARMRRALPTKEHLSAFVANLYTDLMINNRLQREMGLNMAGVYQALGGKSKDKLWALYMRMCEILWGLQKGTLANRDVLDATVEGDAQLGARLARVYGKHWLEGAGRFAALCFPYLMEDEGRGMQKIFLPWHDTRDAGRGAFPDGLAEMDDDEAEGAAHPSLDDALSGAAPGNEKSRGGKKNEKEYRGPVEYKEILRSLGNATSDEEITIKYYRERAIPYLIKFPVKEIAQSREPLPEGTDTWELGEPLENVDWLESVISSPVIIPGTTTRQRAYGMTEGFLPETHAVDLYLGVDCSGSMINPSMDISYPVLAGAIIALSALRAGSRVMVVLSGEPGKTVSTDGFIRNEHEILKMLTGYLGTGAFFGIHRLHPAFRARKPSDPPVHILIITDTDIFSSLENKQKEGCGWDIANAALEKARGGGTYLLHIPGVSEYFNKATERMKEEGWNVHRVYAWKELLAFAQWFSKINYGGKALVKP